MYTCPWHNAERDGVCSDCNERLANLPAPDTMSADERANELEDWIDKAILSVPFEDLQGRIEALVGRPVWTHELARPDLLVEEIRRRQPATFSDVLDKIPPEKLIVVTTD